MKEVVLTGVVIAKNAEDLIKDCLESLRFCDEVLVVDSGSTDTTRDIAKSFGAKVIVGVANDFAENRNIGMHSAKGMWILYIDTDERVSDKLRESILSQIANVKSQIAAYKIKRKNFYLGKNPWPKIEQLERLFRKDHLKGWYGQIHETAKVDGEVGLLDGYLLHFTHRDLQSMLAKTIIWSKIEAKLRFDSNHPKIVPWRLIRVTMTGFFDSYIRQEGYKAGTMGLIESTYQAYSMFITYANLWEMQEKAKN